MHNRSYYNVNPDQFNTKYWPINPKTVEGERGKKRKKNSFD